MSSLKSDDFRLGNEAREECVFQGQGERILQEALTYVRGLRSDAPGIVDEVACDSGCCGSVTCD
jgi:hypothetical protein